jgi:hypothetical protein
MSNLKPHESQWLSNHGVFDRLAVPGGWLYRVWKRSSASENDNGYAALCFVPDPTAPHVRDRRRLRLRDGWEFRETSETTVWFEASDDPWSKGVIERSKYARWQVTAWHADRSQTRHESLLEAHDALVESGSPSPFEVVTGSTVDTPQTHA